MEAFLLTCLQVSILAGRINDHPQLSPRIKNDLIWELKQVTKEECSVDANLSKERELENP
jgi:hypothetical protein